jgi:hypothetical protein
VHGVELSSTRPQVAQRLMAGREPAQAAELAGLVFSLCGRAQRVACELACAAADCVPADPEADRVRTRRVLMELAQEHAWRLLLDWPECLPDRRDLAPDRVGLVALRQATAEPMPGPRPRPEPEPEPGSRRVPHTDPLADRLEGLVADWLGLAPSAWLALDLAGLADWSARGETLLARLFRTLGEGPDPGASTCPLLPQLGRLGPEGLADLAGRALCDPEFCARPRWAARPAETGAVARGASRRPLRDWIEARGRGLGARMLARLVELALLPEWLRGLSGAGGGGPSWLGARSLGNGVGVGAVETSRGLLLHAVRLIDGRIADYRILAPTEWCFDPLGPLIESLGGLDWEGPHPAPDLERLARLVVRSLDPCVAFGLELRDA